MSKPNASIDVTLVVACVHTGGNTCGGEYFFSYTPNFISVTEPDTIITVQLEDQSGMDLQITNVFACDPNNQFDSIKIYQQQKQVVIHDLNTVNELVPFTILLTDKNGNSIACDPQTGNGGGIGMGTTEFYD